MLSTLPAQFFAAMVGTAVMALPLAGALGLAGRVLDASECGFGFSSHRVG
jgi:hypothetical protein